MSSWVCPPGSVRTVWASQTLSNRLGRPISGRAGEAGADEPER